METSAASSLIERVERLERSTLRSKWIAAASLIGVLTLIAGGADQARVVDAERIVLRDKGGKIHAVLEVADDGTPRFAMFDEKGNPGVEFEVKPNFGSSLYLKCEEGGSLIQATANPRGSSHMNINVADGQEVMLEASGRHEKSAEIWLGPLGGPSQIRLACDQQHRFRRIELNGPKGEAAPRLSLYASPDGSMEVTATDKDDQPRLMMGTKADGSSFLDLRNRDGTVFFQPPSK